MESFLRGKVCRAMGGACSTVTLETLFRRLAMQPADTHDTPPIRIVQALAQNMVTHCFICLF
jgi:hypothetical protein